MTTKGQFFTETCNLNLQAATTFSAKLTNMTGLSRKPKRSEGTRTAGYSAPARRSNCLSCLFTLVLALCATDVSVAQDVGSATGLQLLSKDDYHRIKVSSNKVGGALPNSYSLEKFFPAPGAQGQQQSCAAWAVAYNKSYRLFRASGSAGNPQDFLQSPAFLYSGLTGGKCHGTVDLAESLKFIREQGSVSWAVQPYSASQCDSWEDHKSAAHMTSEEPERLDDDKDLALIEIRNHLISNDPIITGILACDEFNTPTGPKNDEISMIAPDDRSCSAHAVLIVGYDNGKKFTPAKSAATAEAAQTGGVLILNSQGLGWGDSGMAWMSYSVLKKRLIEAYIDSGPPSRPEPGTPAGQNPPGMLTDSEGALPPPPEVVTEEILRAALRTEIAPTVLRTFVDRKGVLQTVNQWALWLDLPEQYGDEIRSLSFTLHDKTFRHPLRPNVPESTVFLTQWEGFGCVDRATLKAKINDGHSITFDFDFCALAASIMPKR